METIPAKSGPSDDVRSRIIQAAEALWLEQGSDPTRKPRLPEVRARARADMNATGEVLNEWWRNKIISIPKTVAVPVPQPVMDAFMGVLADAWTACQQEANANLAAAQSNWVKERALNDETRQELSDLFEKLNSQFEELTERHIQALGARDQAVGRANDLADQVQALREQLTEQTHLVEQAEARIEEIEHRANDLKGELSSVHEEAQQVRNELREARELHFTVQKQTEAVAAQAVEEARMELATYRGKAESLLASRDERVRALETKLDEQQEKVGNLQSELATARAEVFANDKLFQTRKQEMADAAHKATERFTRLQNERDEAHRRAADAENQASHLAGKLESVESQNRSLLALFPKSNANN